MKKKKFALLHLGTNDALGLIFVAGEIKKQNHIIKWFDGEEPDVVDKILSWVPDYFCCSPMTTHFTQCVNIANKLKEFQKEIRTVFGGHHVSAVPETVGLKEIDIIVKGPVHGTIEKIISSNKKEIIFGKVVDPSELIPDRIQYYKDISRIAQRHRKLIMSHFGCVYNCSYCSTSRLRKEIGILDYKKGWLQRRPIPKIIDEAKIFLEYDTQSVQSSDDDMLYGDNINEWLPEFAASWKKEINLPIYGYVTPASLRRCNKNTIKIFSELVCSAMLGIQSISDDSLKLLNRQHQKKEDIIQAVRILKDSGIPIKVDIIVGLPVKDPIKDAFETIKFVQSTCGPGTVCDVYPLMLFPGTELSKWCQDNKIKLNEKCNHEFYTGYGSIDFDWDTKKKVRNLVKLGSFFVKYNIAEHWMQALSNIEIDENAAKEIASCNYMDSVLYRQKNLTIEQARSYLSSTLLKY